MGKRRRGKWWDKERERERERERLEINWVCLDRTALVCLGEGFHYGVWVNFCKEQHRDSIGIFQLLFVQIVTRGEEKTLVLLKVGGFDN